MWQKIPKKFESASFLFCTNFKNLFNFNIALSAGLELLEHKAKVQNIQASFWIAHLRIFLPVSVVERFEDCFKLSR